MIAVLRRLLARFRQPSSAVAGSSTPTGGRIVAWELHTCTVFFSFLRLHGLAAVAVDPAPDADSLKALFRATVSLGGDLPHQSFSVTAIHPNGTIEFSIEAITARARDIGAMEIELKFGADIVRIPVEDQLRAAQSRDMRSLFPEFQQIIADHQSNNFSPPRLLDVGGRARSDVQRSAMFPNCTVTVIDIVADPGVDVVGDAHELSHHFVPDSFDFIMSISVFEHLLMPWKVAIEMNRVLRTGGIVLVHTHQTVGMHDMPWDFWRFSDTSWAAIFNRYTGFEVVKTDMSRFMHVIPRVLLDAGVNSEGAGGFECSTVMVRKTGPAMVTWDVPLSDVVATNYPTAMENPVVRHSSSG